MLSRTDAAARRLALLLCTLLAGCTGLPQSPPGLHLPFAAPLPQSAKTPATPLAITGPAVPPTGNNAGITPASFRQVAAPEKAAETPGSAPVSDLDQIRRLTTDAQQQYGQIHSYIARLRRREVVNGREKPEEVMIFYFRKQPWSIHFKFLNEEAKGREVVYVKGQPGDQLHILTAGCDFPFPAGKRLDLAHNSPFVKAANKHDITEAGVGNNIDVFANRLDAVAQGKAPGVVLKYLGKVQRPEYPVPLEGVEIKMPPGRDIDLPNGGLIETYFDAATKFPVVYVIHDQTGRVVEYDCFDRFQLDGLKLDDDDFNPDKLWGKK
jgi:hypothetical protein